MSKTLTIVSVKCIKPSSGIDDITKSIFATVSGVIAALPVYAASEVSGGSLVKVETVNQVAGKVQTKTLAAIEGLDRTFTGTDELYIKVNGSKIWPSGKYNDIKSQQIYEVGYSLPLDKQITIQLWEYDKTSSDDPLGNLTLGSDHPVGKFTYLVQNKDEGSIYFLDLRIA